MYDLYQKFETATLKNGLTVYNLHWPERAGVRFEFLIHSGGRHDPIGKEGAAHFMEHLVSENALVSNSELRHFFEQNTGEHPGFGRTGPNATMYGFLSSTEPALLAQSLTYYGHMLLHASLEKEIERERQVIFGEYDREYGMPIKYDINYRMRQAAFSNTFFGRFLTVLGTKETIGTMTQSDLQSFYDTHYTPANMSVIVIGELTLAQTVAALENSPFSEFKPGVRTPMFEVITDPPLPTENEYRFHEGEHFKGSQSASFMSKAQLSGTLSTTAVRIVDEMISKQVFKIVRLENAWTYHIGCNIGFLGDFYEFSVSSSSLDVKAMDTIAQVVTDCVEITRTQQIEFEETKKKIIASKRFIDPNVYSICRAVRNDLQLFGRIITLTEELREAEAIQMSDIYPVIDGLAANRRWTMIGYP